MREAALQRIVALAARLFDCPRRRGNHRRRGTSLVRDVRWPRGEGRTARGDVRRLGDLVRRAARRADARKDPRFRGFSSVREGRIVSYAGAPLVSATGLRIGAFCITDERPRSPLSVLERQRLRDFADLAMSEIESRRARTLNGILQGIANTVGAALVCTNEAGTIVLPQPGRRAAAGLWAHELIGRDVAVIVRSASSPPTAPGWRASRGGRPRARRQAVREYCDPQGRGRGAGGPRPYGLA